jgi:amino acid adenylation domain-containing protein
MTLLAGWAVLLSRLSGQEDIVIGTSVANRNRLEIEGLIGLFLNMLALRLDVFGSPTVSEWMGRVKEQTMAAQQHQDIPFEQVVEIVGPVRSLAHSPLFQVGLSWQNAREGRLTLPGLEVRPLRSAEHRVAKIDLTLFLHDTGERIAGELEYATALFERSTVERYLGCLRSVLEAMVAGDDQAVDSLPLLTEADRQKILYGWNETGVEYGRDNCVHELFEEQVSKTPEAEAVAFEGASLTYFELNRQANQLAHYLRGVGARPDTRVGICVERGLQLMVGLLGVLKAGGAYVPLDPAYPVDRLKYMIEDSAPVALLTQAHLREALVSVDLAVPVLDLPDAARQWQAQPETNPDRRSFGLVPKHLAYVIYTSGSTGTPKGVMVEHAGLCNYLRWASSYYAPESSLVSSSFSFDGTVTSLYTPLLSGGTVRLVREREEIDGLYTQLQASGCCDLVKATPAHLDALGYRMLSEGADCHAGIFVIGGEALLVSTVDLWRQIKPGLRLVNEYGPTETVVGCTVYEVPADFSDIGQGTSVPIGRPLANARIYILDGRGEPVPVGVTGEIYIAGAGVARGYLNRPELTAERFVVDPFAGNGADRMYKTGDLGKWMADGNIEFLGRNDLQVKIRGFRIELREIEAVLAQHEDISEAVVLAREDTPGDVRLVAYYKCVETDAIGQRSLGAEELRNHLAAKLPEFMVPAAYVQMESLPLTANGKLDRKALAAPHEDAYGVGGYEEPIGDIEILMAGIWADVLKLERVGRHDNFFELGGNSLLAVRLNECLRRAGLQVDVRSLFATPTPAALAAAFGSGDDIVNVPPNGIPSPCEAITPEMLPLVLLTSEEIDRIVQGVPGGAANVQDIYPLAPLQEGILFHHFIGGNRDPYLKAVEYSFDNRSRLDAYLKALQAVIDRHDILRTAVLWDGLPEPVQVVWRKAELPIEEVVFEAGIGDVAGELYRRYNPLEHPMDVRQAPLLRVVIAKDEGKQRWVMMKLLHHLTGDHTAMEMMQDEIQAFLLEEGNKLPEPLPFRNLVAQARLGVSREEHERYFRQLLGDVEEPTAPFGLLNVQGNGKGLELERMRVDADLSQRMREQARSLGVSAASVCHVAWAQVLARVSQREDVVFGTVLFGRMQGGEGSDRVMGLFINTLPVRIGIGDEGAEQCVLGAHRQLAELMRHEHASLAMAQRCSAVAAPKPLFSALLNYRYSRGKKRPRSEERKRAWEGIYGLHGEEYSNYPLTLSVDDLGDDFKLTAQVEAAVGAQRVCELMHTALESLVDALENEPDKPVGTLEVMPEAERQKVLYQWNLTE